MPTSLSFLSHSITIPYFWLFWSLAVSTALIFYFKRIQQKFLNFIVSWNLSITILLSSLIGARLLHVIYEEPQYYLEHPLEVFFIWNGGLVFYGGLLALLFAVFIFFHKLRIQPWDHLDALAPCVSLGYLIGRIGCLFNGCCYGSFCNLPWAIENRHPTQIYASLLELMVLLFVLFIEKYRLQKFKGLIFCLWLFLHSIARLIVESFRGDPRGPEIAYLSISTWLSFILLTSSVGIGLALVKKK